jgi:N-methylhydantoinase A
VTERLTGLGEPYTPLNVADLEALRALLDAAGVTDKIEAAAVCFLHAFANPVHEQQAAEWLRRELPHVSLSLSHEVAPQIREYERMSTTVCNAYVQPLTSRYLERLRKRRPSPCG